ncbi:MAG: putative acetyl-CoA acyltransferase [Candidatus Thorarchaeota archaeon AB_25]|nr:MAG: putative acetyl-CoA acyltransferase [Candidatus Thorarchaeota archaeon AB_25]
MARKVAVVAGGHSKFGKRYDATMRELSAEAYKPIYDEGLTQDKIDASILSYAASQFTGQGAGSALIADYIGLQDKPHLRVESACTTGTASLRAAWGMVAAGLYDVMLVLGVEQMNRVSSATATEYMSQAGDMRWEYPFGISFPAFYALMASRYMSEYGMEHDVLAKISVKSHHYGAQNPKAHLPKEVSFEEANNAVPICRPLNLYDCSLITDGAAAVVIAAEDRVKEFTDRPMWIKGIGAGASNMMIQDRPNLTSIPGAKRAADAAYKMAGVGPNDIDMAQVHDCFSIAELIAYEDCGFAEPGKGRELIENKEVHHEGRIPVNCDGGLKSKGHPLGATGVSMTYEIMKQMRGEAENQSRQIDDVKLGLAHNVGQSGQFVNVFIFERGW